MHIHTMGDISRLNPYLEDIFSDHTWTSGLRADVRTDLILAGSSPSARDAAMRSGKPWAWVMTPTWMGNISGAHLLICTDLSETLLAGMDGIPTILATNDADRLTQHLQAAASGEKSRVVFIASEGHYLRHLTPTARQIHPDCLGVTLVPLALAPLALLEGHLTLSWAKDVSQAQYGLQRGVDPSQSLAMVVSLADQVTAEKLGFSVVRGEHGIGQTYDSPQRSSSYAGSAMHARLYAYLAPGIHPYLQHRANCPGVVGYRVGSPFLDRFPVLKEKQTDIVGFVFHWDNQAQAETRSTWAYWVDPILDLLNKGVVVRLHCHPREAANFRAKFLIPHHMEHLWVETMAELHREADVICGDNTSALYFMAASGHPVVMLNHPTYRREIEHGLRFWECSDVGIPCDKKWDLEASIERASAREDVDLEFREEALRYTFFRFRGASVVEALLLEALLEFRRGQAQGSRQTVVARISLDAGCHGMLTKGETYSLDHKGAEELQARGWVDFAEESPSAGFPWPRRGAQMPEARTPGEKLYQVVEKFSDHGVDYKPGDFVRKKEILSENLTEKCKVYEAKARRHQGMETK